MSDPLRTDPSRVHDAASAGDRDAKIEQLLLLGLDHYFAAEYDQAINVWTRALFLDRTHPRARAYIDRARSALAERLRESEELLHNGADAFRRGDAEQARELLLAAIERGAPAEEASALLDRLSRLETAAGARAGRSAPSTAGRTAADRPRPRRTPAAWAVSAGLVAVIACGVFLAADWRQVWRATFGQHAAASRPVASPPAHDVMPPPPRRGEMALARARSLASGGHLHDALDLLGTVRLADPQRADADRLRADIERQLLSLAALPAAPSREKGGRSIP